MKLWAGNPESTSAITKAAGPGAMDLYTTALMGPFLGQAMAGLGGHGRPASNVVISNVPGLQEARYDEGSLMREYDPAHVQLVEAVAEFGEVDAIRTIHRNVNATPRSLQAIICQSMVHDIHSVRFITGCEITAVSTFGGGPSTDSFRHVLLRGQLDNGGHALLEFDDGGFAYEVSVEVLAKRGSAVTGEPVRAVVRRDGWSSRFIGPDWFARFADAYRIQNAAWVASIADGNAVGPSAWDAFVAQQVIAAAMESLATGRTIDVEHSERPAIYA